MYYVYNNHIIRNKNYIFSKLFLTVHMYTLSFKCLELPMTTDNVVQLKPRNTEDVDEFITPTDIAKMSDEDIEQLVMHIRSRRMKVFTVYNASKKEKSQIKQVNLQERMEKKCEQIIKKLSTIDKQIIMIERYADELRGLRIAAQLDPMI